MTSNEIVCGLKPQNGRESYAFFTAILLMLLLFIAPSLSGQCIGEVHDLRAYSTKIASSREGASKIIKATISGTTNCSAINLEISFQEQLPQIDSLILKWKDPLQAALFDVWMIWSQSGDRHTVKCEIVLDHCSPIQQNQFDFDLIVFPSDTSTGDWEIDQLNGTIVEVDVIQGKTSIMETQRIYTINGRLIREIKVPANSPVQSAGLERGIYLVKRMKSNMKVEYEKILVR